MKKVDLEFKKPFGGGIINLSTGSGKTIVSLYIIAKYKLKSLIIVNTVELLNQWSLSIEKFLPDAKIGIIRGDKFDKKSDICIGMIQTISMRKEYTKEMFSDFGITFIDECHHLSSEVFSETLFKCRSKYTFGLSATVERKDGLEYVFHYHLGDIIFSDKDLGNTKQKSKIEVINFSSDSFKEITTWNGKLNFSSMINMIAENMERNKTIIEKLKSLPNHSKVLVLSDRISQLKYLSKFLGEEAGLFIGKTDKEEKNVSRGKKFMLATYAIASEGFNHPELNTLLFATPRSSITQAVGRIYRKTHKNPPLIIDIVDNFSVFKYMYKKRDKIYKELSGGKKEEENACLFD
jgi:superfamily II DNA or RNA helicase